jgi:16S rRNA (guanine966-N2)-methyltransferase
VRVVAGEARGRRLAPVPAGTRPVSDRAREGLFSSLGELLPGARVLDLFAGTGALGIEALSRGAVSATFVERSPEAIATIHSNLERTGMDDRARVMRRDARRFPALGSEATAKSRETYDLVLADPPYDTPPRTLDALISGISGLLAGPRAVAVLTRPDKGYMPVVPVNLQVARRLRYGDSLILVYREV